VACARSEPSHRHRCGSAWVMEATRDGSYYIAVRGDAPLGDPSPEYRAAFLHILELSGFDLGEVD